MIIKASENILPRVVFAFNRPDKLGRVLSASSSQNIYHLIMFADGPRDNTGRLLVEQRRTIIRV